ncbi:MAG: hypothetical protein QM775_18600 [Pirellulales bacterium]
MKHRRIRRRAAPLNRRAVILLVMLGLLSLFTLIAVTFVVAAGQFRRGAATAASAERMGDPFDTLLQQAMMQVARGSNHPQSAIGPHSLLEDMYGNGDAVTGCCFIDASQIGGSPPLSIYTTGGSNMTTRAARAQPYKGMPGLPKAPMLIEIGAVSFGWDREPGVALADDSTAPGANGIVDDISEIPDRADVPLAGDDCFLGSTYAHPAMVGEPPATWVNVWQNKMCSDGNPLPLIDNIDNYYAGRVITFVNGDSAGQSAYIVRSKLIPVTPTSNANVQFRTILYIKPFANGSQPSHKDRFVINGRAFNGAGFGYNPYDAQSLTTLQKKPAYEQIPNPVSGGPAQFIVPNPRLRALDMPYSEPFINTPSVDGTPYGGDPLRSNRVPIAYLPNPIDGGYRDYLNRYNPIVEADEDYDAPDEQNMLLSYSVWVPSLNGSDPGRYRTIMPSLHRPDLVKFFTFTPGLSVQLSGTVPFPRWSDVPPFIRRRYILRPDPSDHYDWTQEPNAVAPQNADGWTPGEPFQDVNNNGQWDPVTVLNGAPGPAEPYTDLANPSKNNTYDIGDRAYFNTGFDALDGPWDVDNDNDNLADSIWVDLGAPATTAADGRIVKPLFAILVRDLDGRINVNAHGSVKHYDRVPAAYTAYNPASQPTPYQTNERVRMGMYTWALYQIKPDVDWNTVDTMKTHTAGDPDAKRDDLSMRDVPFQGIWALPYAGDGPFLGNSPTKATNYVVTVPNAPTYPLFNGNRGGPRPLMFDLKGASNSGGTAVDQNRMIRGFEPAVGQGFSVADINLAPILQTSIWGMTQLPSSNTSASTTTSFASYNYYRVLLEGTPNFNGAGVPTPGRYGESYLLSPSGPGGAFPGIVGPRAGVTDAYLPLAWQLHLPSPPLPLSGQIAPQRGDDNFPVSPSRFIAASNDPRFWRGNVFRDSFMPVAEKQYTTQETTFTPRQYAPSTQEKTLTYGITVPLAGDNRYSPSPYGAFIGDYGTPGDLDGDGYVALDVRGQPVYQNMGTANETIDDPTEINLHRRYFAQTYFGSIPAGTVAYNIAGVPYTTDVDAPYTPAELERLLRSRDANSDSLPNRLRNALRGDGDNGDVDNYDMRRSVTSESWDIPCPHVAPTPELAAAMRMLNLPIGSPSIGDLLRARFYLATGTRTNNPQLVLKTARLATIAQRSYKWQVSGDVTAIPGYTNTASLEVQGQIPVSSGRILTLQGRQRWHTRLVSPDLGLGLRMDLNAPFGNGFDEDPDGIVKQAPDINNGVYDQGVDPLNTDPNGVVDEPREWVYGGGLNGSIHGWVEFDGNRDGNFLADLDEEPRQQFAKELYCLMMLLIDENYVEVRPASVSAASMNNGAWVVGTETSTAAGSSLNMNPLVAGSSSTTPIYPGIDSDPNNVSLSNEERARLKMRRWLLARRIAQWAVNVVDFRDRDSIMTGFEFDADPFYDNDNDTASEANLAPNLPTSNGTWDVDGYLLPHTLFPSSLTAAFPDTDKVWRGVVWGCEYPDLVITETAAFHDRRTQNLKTLRTGTNYLSFGGTSQNALVDDTETDLPVDPHWDSRRIPQGTALFELYATGNPNNPALPRELYSLHQTTGDLYLDLARTASKSVYVGGSPQTLTYPVWRLAITESHYENNDQDRPVVSLTDMHMSPAHGLREFPATCSLDPADRGMSLFNTGLGNITTTNFVNTAPTTGQSYVPIERIVTFMQGNQSAATLTNAKEGLVNSAGNNTGIEVYVNTVSTNNPCWVLPGDYVVVGPGRDVVSGPRNITTIGRTMPRMIVETTGTGVTMETYAQPQSIIDMGDPDAGGGRYFIHTSVNGVDEYPVRYVGANPLTTLVRNTSSVANNILDTPGFLQIRPPVSVPCMVTLGSRRVGLNISEPLTTSGQYYPAPTTTSADSWLPSLVTQDTYATVHDIPLDEATSGPSGSHNPNFSDGLPPPTDPPPPTPARPGESYEDRTLLNYKTVFLQRLADPTRGWDRWNNPYLTIDWMPIDLTIFNGEPHYVYQDPPASGTWKKDITLKTQLTEIKLIRRLKNMQPADTSKIPSGTVRFGSRQRGAPRTPFRGNASFYDLWSQPDWLDTSVDMDTRPPITGPVKDSFVKVVRTNGATTREYYKVNSVRWQDPFDHTFGYLNLGYHTMRAPVTGNRGSLPMQQISNWVDAPANLSDGVTKLWLRMSPVREPLRRPFGDAGLFAGWFTGSDLGGNLRYVGSPRRPFNWLTWNNRPFAGSMELMLVPATSQARLLCDYSMRETTSPTVPNDNNPTSGAYFTGYAPFSPRRSANHYMPPVAVPKDAVSSGHTPAYKFIVPEGTTEGAANPYAGTFISGYISKPPYGHLLNFFESRNAVGSWFLPSGTPNVQPIPATNNYSPQPLAASNYYRLFEYVTVPSRMSGGSAPHYTNQYNRANGALTIHEHLGFPFTAPFNAIPNYREPGRVNINTIIPLNPKSYSRTESPSNLFYLAQHYRNERLRDDGAAIWRAITNDFHPSIRWAGSANVDLLDAGGMANSPSGSAYNQTAKSRSMQRQQTTSTISNKIGTRAGFMTDASDVTHSPYFFNPQDDYVSSFYALFASMFRDSPNADPRGPNGVYENWQYWNANTGAIFSDDRFGQPFSNYNSPAGLSRHEGVRPSMISNPFRSFAADFSNTPPDSPFNPLPTYTRYDSNKRFSAMQYKHPISSTSFETRNFPLLAIDATLLRRADTTWSPWHENWLPANLTASDLTPTAASGNAPPSKLYSPAFVDPRFDPLFALNYPRPFRMRNVAADMFSDTAIFASAGSKPMWWLYSGYTSPLFEYIQSQTATKAYSYGASVDAIRIKDSDYRNTDRNPFFRYQLYTKLSNTVTTRSNVYAVWVTVGYFECERVQPTTIYPVQTGHSLPLEFNNKHRYPDGYRIMRELGSDNGEAVRHRSFAIIDRTIPVGFLRGENLNVDRCFLIKRIVE